MAVKPTVLVVGAGLIGASIARHLARAGAAVMVIDAGEPGGLATRASWGWINACWGNPQAYFRLRLAAIAEWHRLAVEVPGVGVNWCGGLIWDLPQSELDQYAEQHGTWGYDIRPVTRAQILALEPSLKSAPEQAYHVPVEGMLEPLQAASALLADARKCGAEIIAPMSARWLVEKHGKVVGVQTEEGALHADETVVAAGTATASLIDSIGLRLSLTAPPGLLAHTKPLPKLLNGLVMTPGLHIRQTTAGRVVAGTDFAGADPVNRAGEMSEDLMVKLRALVAGAERATLDFHTTGLRPTPADGFPAAGRLQGRAGLYAAVTHSGVTLAAILGRFVAEELLDGRRDPLLAPYSPDRAELQ